MLRHVQDAKKLLKADVPSVKKFGTVAGNIIFKILMQRYLPYFFSTIIFDVVYFRECQVKDWSNHKIICEKISKSKPEGNQEDE